MAKIMDSISRTFSEYLLIPQLTRKENLPSNVSLRTPVSRFNKGSQPGLFLNIPFVSASMQSVSGIDMAVSLARYGGLSFIYCSQPVESQALMVSKVKQYKAGFVESDSNVDPDTPLKDALKLIRETGHSTVAVTEDGTKNGRFTGILTDKDFWEFEDDIEAPVSKYMTPLEKVVYGKTGITLHEANRLLHKHKKECLPILDKNGYLNTLVFKKDYVDHRKNPLELLDERKRLSVGAGINTWDYKDRVPALIEAGADVLSFDTSDGYSEFQKEAALWIRKKYGDSVVLGGGNIVSASAFTYLAEEALIDFVKVGIGGGSICITRGQKGIGRGQASAVIDVVRERDRYFKKTGTYIPVCSDGGLANDTQIIVALALGADFVMMGRYFAMTNESPTPKTFIKGQMFKPYWGEGSARANNWKRYQNQDKIMKFEEGIDAYVPVAGSVREVLDVTLAKIKSTMCNMGACGLSDFRNNAVLTRISEQSFVEGGTSNVIQRENESSSSDY